MSLICALICDLLIDLVIHLLMMDLESPSTITSMKPISIPVSMTSKHAIASTSKAVPTAIGKRDLKIMTSLLAFRAIIADVDLRSIQSNEASKLILMVWYQISIPVKPKHPYFTDKQASLELSTLAKNPWHPTKTFQRVPIPTLHLGHLLLWVNLLTYKLTIVGRKFQDTLQSIIFILLGICSSHSCL
ncbi:uncharacterized protein [Gossypium hirsutum]|uniref:Uncharacterized protein n=1 Tax=Gossypium hirsutum TaxID=3635 RepID=A0ABM3AEY1_GOSHI|nr:uncharacterized protein LOC121219389 [Gossypium hirsutum]